LIGSKFMMPPLHELKGVVPDRAIKPQQARSIARREDIATATDHLLQHRDPVCVRGNSSTGRCVSHEGDTGRTQWGGIMINQQ
jgi:hypothetical protein